MCSPELREPLENLVAGSRQILTPDLAVSYGFEYAFRLFLVYCYTRKNTVRAICNDDRNAFDTLFSPALGEVLSAVANDKAIAVDKDMEASLLTDVNRALVNYLKSSMKASPAVLARNLAEGLDRKVRKAGIIDGTIGCTSIYAEEDHAR